MSIKFKWPKINWPITTEIIGVSLASYGLFLILPAIALIALGSFLVYITEKE
jgi:uncharacterized membrane protein